MITEQPALVSSQKIPTLYLAINGHNIAIDDDGYLLDSREWSPDVAEKLADIDGIELSEDHWFVLDFIRDYYQEYDISPDLCILQHNLCKKMAVDYYKISKYLKQVFPDYFTHCPCKYAGVPKPIKSVCS